MPRSRAERENGRRDVRALPVALMVWAVSLGAWSGASRSVAWVLAAGMLGLGSVALVASVMARHGRDGGREQGSGHGQAYGRGRDGGREREDDAGWFGWGGQTALWMATVGVAACCALLSAASHAQAGERDVLARAVADGDASPAWLDAAVTVPPAVSDRRSHDCRFDVRATVAAVAQGQGARGAVAAPSRTTVRVYANGSGCAVIRGGVYRFAGTIEKAEYGSRAIWLSTDGPAGGTDSPPAMLANPPPWHRLATLMRARFQQVTERLPDQGRVLVPGLTLGVLGNEAIVGAGVVGVDMTEAAIAPDAAPDVASDESAEPVDGKVAQAMEDRFRDAGIMHLMAVSGGHFMVVAAVVRRLCAWLLAPRAIFGPAPRVVAGMALAAAYMALAVLMQPSDSVLRALAMGLLMVVAGIRGRPSQAMPSLCWTVTFALLMDPTLASSYGFALSAAAVAGLVLHADAIEGGLARHCPRPIAAAASLTIAAQVYTLPIQVLIEPRVALHAVIANVAVAPFVTFATVAGLGALALAAVCEPLALALAFVASAGTWAMDEIARVVSSMPLAVVPWAQGVGGAILLGVLESALAVALHAGAWRAGRRVPAHGVAGVHGVGAVRPDALPTPYERARRWWADTWAMIGS